MKHIVCALILSLFWPHLSAQHKTFALSDRALIKFDVMELSDSKLSILAITFPKTGNKISLITQLSKNEGTPMLFCFEHRTTEGLCKIAYADCSEIDMISRLKGLFADSQLRTFYVEGVLEQTAQKYLKKGHLPLDWEDQKRAIRKIAQEEFDTKARFLNQNTVILDNTQDMQAASYREIQDPEEGFRQAANPKKLRAFCANLFKFSQALTEALDKEKRVPKKMEATLFELERAMPTYYGMSK